MPSIFECPSCGKKLKIPDDLLGKTVRCSDCAGTFLAEKPRPAAPLLPPLPRDDSQPRPSRRPSQLTPEGMMPHRGGLVLAFGIIALVTSLLSGGGIMFGGASAGFTGGFGLILAGGGIVFNIVGLVLGILSWIWGTRDLALMKAGVMVSSGHGMTLAGYICGIIGTILNAITLIGSCIITVLVLLIGVAGVAALGCCVINASKNMPPPPPQRPPFQPQRFQAPSPLQLQDYLPGRK